MRYTPTTGQLSTFLTGCGFGAAMMYLLDPEEGASRREYVGEVAGRAARGTGKVLGSTWEVVREKASDLGQATAAGASAFGQRVRDAQISRRIGQGVSSVGSEVADRARYVVRGRPASSRYLPQSPVSGTALALGCIALGIGAMYLLDPSAGRRRRALIRDKALSMLKHSSRNMQKTGRHLWNRSQGFVHGMRSAMSKAEPSDRVLADRIRSAIGHVVSDPSTVLVVARSGRVTVSGSCPKSEVDTLLKTIWQVPGVKDLVNQLELHEGISHAAISDLPGQQITSPVTVPASVTMPGECGCQ